MSVTTLKIRDPETKKYVYVDIGSHENGITLRPDGYGVAPMEDGHGETILLDYFDGKLQLFVWADINQEDPTHVIDMAGALETNRRNEDDDET